MKIEIPKKLARKYRLARERAAATETPAHIARNNMEAAALAAKYFQKIGHPEGYALAKKLYSIHSRRARELEGKFNSAKTILSLAESEILDHVHAAIESKKEVK